MRPYLEQQTLYLTEFAAQVKVDWSPNPDRLIDHSRHVAAAALAVLESQGIEDTFLPLFQRSRKAPSQLRTLPPAKSKLLLAKSISPLPLHKTLVLLDCLKKYYQERYHRHQLLALAKALVHSSNLHFGPEVGVGPAKKDAPVIDVWLAGVRAMGDDLRQLQRINCAPALVYQADSRRILDVLEPDSIDAVITSPPYPNEKEYTRAYLSFSLQRKCERNTVRKRRYRTGREEAPRYTAEESWRSYLQLPLPEPVAANGAIQSTRGKGVDYPAGRRLEILLCGENPGNHCSEPDVSRNQDSGLDAWRNRDVCPQRRAGAARKVAIQPLDRYF